MGLGFVFMPLTLAAVSGVADRDTGLASGVLNTTQQIGGSIGLATLSTIFVSVLTSRADELGAAAAAGSGLDPALIAAQAQVYGYSTALYVASGMAALAFLVALLTIKVRAEEAAAATPVHVG
ncbi:MAG: hypothetical protein H0T85_00650 [Geodermatophilaceae bacterium]|nr:hypothetical protein [Geodermatophilaceae bacterium]